MTGDGVGVETGQQVNLDESMCCDCWEKISTLKQLQADSSSFMSVSGECCLNLIFLQLQGKIRLH